MSDKPTLTEQAKRETVRSVEFEASKKGATVSYGSQHKGEKVTWGWTAWLKQKFGYGDTKADTEIGAKGKIEW